MCFQLALESSAFEFSKYISYFFLPKAAKKATWKLLLLHVCFHGQHNISQIISEIIFESIYYHMSYKIQRAVQAEAKFLTSAEI